MKKSKLLLSILGLGSSLILSGCDSLFIFGKPLRVDPNVETFDDTNNCIFFALYNYYGYSGQHFTNKWLGMKDALANHGVVVTGDTEGQAKARNFKIQYTKDCDLPDFKLNGKRSNVYMVNNQEWDVAIQFVSPFAKYHPMAVISTCNGVEFVSSPILASQMGISNATMGSFSDEYRAAFKNGSLKYLCAKYSANLLPIIAAGVDAVDNKRAGIANPAMKNADGTALALDNVYWPIQTISQFDEMKDYDSVSEDAPTLRKINFDKFFDTNSSDYGAEKLTAFMKKSSKEDITKLYEENNGELKTQIRFDNQRNNFAKGDTFSLENMEVLHKKDANVTYTSSDENILKIQKDNTIEAKKVGNATITVSAGDVSSSISINVVDKLDDKNKTYYSSVDNGKEFKDPSNRGLKTQDENNFRKGDKIKLGIIAPSTLNTQVSAYIEFMSNYLTKAYNLEILPVGSVTNSIDQTAVCRTLINQQADLIISTQDDTARVAAIKAANDSNVFFGIVGSNQNPVDYAQVKELPYYIGSVGTSVEEERKATKAMTEYYLQCMIKRAKSEEELINYQLDVKGLASQDDATKSKAYYIYKDKEKDI